MLRKFLLVFLLSALFLTPQIASSDQPGYFEMTLLTTNDLHANLLPYDEDPSLASKVPDIKSVGGAVRRASIIRQIRSEKRTPVLLLDSGDTTYGTNPIAKAYHGVPDVAVMNAIGYLVMAPGNHDFQWPAQDTLRNLKDSRFPWVCANLVDGKTGKPYLTPYVIREFDGVRIAFLGLITQLVTTNKKAYKAATELGLETLDPLETAAKLVPELRQKADIVVLLSHLGTKLDTELADKVPGVDVILGGHSHTRLAVPKMISTGEPTAFSIGAVPVVQAFRWGGEMGRTQVIFRRDPSNGRYKLMSCRGSLIPVNSSVPDDPQIAGIIRNYQSKVKASTQQPGSQALK